MVLRLHSISIFVHGPEPSVSFYRDTLGLSLEREGDFGAEFRSGDVVLGICPARTAAARTLIGRHTGVTLAVENLAAFCVRLRRQGVSFTSELSRTPWGKMAMIADPDGNILALMDEEDLR